MYCHCCTIVAVCSSSHCESQAFQFDRITNGYFCLIICMEPSETMRVNTKEEGFQASSSLILPSPMFEVLGLAFTDLPMATCCLVSASLKPRRKNSWPSPSPQPILVFLTFTNPMHSQVWPSLERILALFDYISSTFLILKQLLSWDSFFTSWKLSWVRPCQEGILLIVLWREWGLSLMVPIYLTVAAWESLPWL